MLSQEEVFDALNLKERGIKLEFVKRLFSYFAARAAGNSDSDDRRGGVADLNAHSFFLGAFNFCSLPRGDYMTRFLFQLYGGDEYGMSALEFRVMCDDMLDGGWMALKNCRLVRLLEHFIEMEHLKESDKKGGGHKSRKSHHSVRAQRKCARSEATK